ncbi:nonstructural protein [Capybara microvirus Cap3_SP_457]|nr:nonstructural protein [Capybara microvirus Cap3_SP_457]
MNVYAFQDVKGAFMHPWLSESDAAATRSFAMELENNSMMKKFPGDFRLWRIAEYDPKTAVIVPSHPIVHVVDATSILGA